MSKIERGVALVTGASSGIGLATARALQRNGYRVFGTSGKPMPEQNDCRAGAAATALIPQGMACSPHGRWAGNLRARLGVRNTDENNSQPVEILEMRTLKQSAVLALTVATALMSSAAWADIASPVGLWRNVDDVSGKPRALIRITESNGTLQGKIEKVFLAPNESPKCEKCEGALKNAPVIGLVILSGLKKDGADYGGGQILDPDNGKVYSSNIRLSDDGRKLNVRGYIGMTLLGRSQIWERQE